MDIVRIVAAGIIITVLAVTMKSMAPQFAIIVSIAGSVLIFMMALPRLAAVTDMLTRVAAQVDTNMVYIYIVLKIVGIAYITEFGAQICADAGESAIASKIELGGKIMIMFVSAPVLMSVVDMILNLLP